MSQLTIQLVSNKLQHYIITIAYRNIIFFTCTVQGMNDPNVHFVTSTPNAQGAYYLSANNNTYYVAIDSNNNIRALLDSKLTTVS